MAQVHQQANKQQTAQIRLVKKEIKHRKLHVKWLSFWEKIIFQIKNQYPSFGHWNRPLHNA